MQTLSVISANIWSILISLVNLALLTWVIRRFLYKPVMKVVEGRRAAIDGDYARAKEAREQAEQDQQRYAAAMAGARQTADQLIAEASRTAEHRGSEIVGEARERANEIRRQAEADAALERKKAEDDMRREIADVSTRLTGKLLEREIRPEDHQALIDSFLREIGDDDNQ